MAKPLVSILMPTCDYGHFIGEAIASILTQTYRRFELIVIDDASLDETHAIVNGFDDDRIVFLQRKTWSGSGVLPRNDGLAVARGQWIAETAADDINLPDRIARQVAFFEQHPDIDLLGGAMVQIDAQGQEISGICRRPVYRDRRDYRRALLKGKTVLFHPTLMFHRRVLDRVPGYTDCACSGDFEFMLRASRYFAFSNLPDVLVYYRRHNQSVSRTFGDALRSHYHRIFMFRELMWADRQIRAARCAE